MKSIILACLLLLAAPMAFAESGNSPSYNPSYGQQEAVENARRGNQREVERLIRRELDRRARKQKPTRSRTANCSKSYWTKREALNFCPPATAMKVRQDGVVFYYCDCE